MSTMMNAMTGATPSEKQNPTPDERALYERCSRSFLTLVSSAAHDLDSTRLAKSVEVWCSGFPLWYQDWVWKELGLNPPVTEPFISNDRLSSAISDLADRLLKKECQCGFLLNDGVVLADAYARRGGSDYLCIRLNRSSWPAEVGVRVYLELFSLINDSAYQTFKDNGDWHSFLLHYQFSFRRFIENTQIGSNVDRVLSSAFRSLLSTDHQRPFIIVDSGMQATFALASTSWLKSMQPFRNFDVHLAVVYPWLTWLFKDRFVTDDPAVLTAIERTSEKITGNSHDVSAA